MVCIDRPYPFKGFKGYLPDFTWSILERFVPNGPSLSLLKHAEMNRKKIDTGLTKVSVIPSRDISDQWILKSDWTRATPGYTQPRVVVLDATFPWLLSLCKRSNISIGFSSDIVDQRILQSDWTSDTIGQT